METKTIFKSFTEDYNPTFHNYQLTELITIKTGKKKGLANSTAVYNIVDSVLRDYGITFFGGTVVRTPQNEETDIQVRYAWIDKEISHENITLIEQLYGWDDSVIDIGISTGESDCQWSFDFNTETKECKLKQNVWGSVRNSMNFESFEEMLSCINNVQDLNTLF